MTERNQDRIEDICGLALTLQHTQEESDWHSSERSVGASKLTEYIRSQTAFHRTKALAELGGLVEDLTSATPMQSPDRTPRRGPRQAHSEPTRPVPQRTRIIFSDASRFRRPIESFTLEHPHLRRRPDHLIHRPDRQEPHRVAVSSGDPLGPVPEFLPGPLEAVIGMA